MVCAAHTPDLKPHEPGLPCAMQGQWPEKGWKHKHSCLLCKPPPGFWERGTGAALASANGGTVVGMRWSWQYCCGYHIKLCFEGELWISSRMPWKNLHQWHHPAVRYQHKDQTMICLAPWWICRQLCFIRLSLAVLQTHWCAREEMRHTMTVILW